MFWIKHQLPVYKIFELDEHSGACSSSSKSQAHIMSQAHIIFNAVSCKCATYFFLVYLLLLTAKTQAFLNFVGLFAKWEACNEKGCEREARWHSLNQFKAWYLVVYNLSMLVCIMIRAFLVWRWSYKTYCSNADSVCLLVGKWTGRQEDLGPRQSWTSDSSNSGKVHLTQFCNIAEIRSAAKLNQSMF